MFALNGITTLVYDKRGVGESGGVYEEDRNAGGENLRLLAADASAAVDRLAADARSGSTPIGLVRLNQAGWVVPLAAAENPRNGGLDPGRRQAVSSDRLAGQAACAAVAEENYPLLEASRGSIAGGRLWRTRPI